MRRLLVDLLEHERLVPALLGALVVPVDLGDGRRLGGEERRALGPDRDDLAVLEELHLPGLGQERGDRGGEEHLALPHPDD
jgi:hypothetical protein